MSYVKLFSDYKTSAAIVSDKEIRVTVETVPERCSGWCFYASGFVSAPNFIERLLGITWQDKLEIEEKSLFFKLKDRVEATLNPPLQIEIDKFLNK